MLHTPAPPPDDEVLAAFGTHGPPELLAGGENRSYRCGDLVLKVHDEGEQTEGLLDLESRLPSTRAFRTARPVRAADGRWVWRGWAAREYLEGRHEPGRWAEIVPVCRAFHDAIEAAPKPWFLQQKGDPARADGWTHADAVTWDEATMEHHPRVAPLVARLRDVLRPVEAPSQLIHGDIGGNILFADGLPPAVLDLSPYWRPASFALGVAVADCVAWDGAPDDLIDEISDVDDWLQMLARGELRRLLEVDTHWLRGRDMLDDLGTHARVIEAICRRA